MSACDGHSNWITWWVSECVCVKRPTRRAIICWVKRFLAWKPEIMRAECRRAFCAKTSFIPVVHSWRTEMIIICAWTKVTIVRWTIYFLSPQKQSITYICECVILISLGCCPIIQWQRSVWGSSRMNVNVWDVCGSLPHTAYVDRRWFAFRHR